MAQSTPQQQCAQPAEPKPSDAHAVQSAVGGNCNPTQVAKSPGFVSLFSTFLAPFPRQITHVRLLSVSFLIHYFASPPLRLCLAAINLCSLATMPFLAFICCIVLLATTFSLPIFAFDLNDDCDGGLYYYQAIPRSGSESSSDQCRISGGTIPGFTSCDDGGYCADGYLCGPTDCTPNVTSTSSSIEPLVTCPELNGYYACPTSLGGKSCSSPTPATMEIHVVGMR